MQFKFVKNQMVSEQIIEEVISVYDNDIEAYEEALAEIIDRQPALLAFLSQESNDVLTEEEKDILWYIILIVITSCRRDGISIGTLSDDKLGNYEEANWQVIQDQPKGTFRDRVTPFFHLYSEEDLLAFVEDTLEIDDESPISQVGREVVFISAKSIIDTIINIQN